MNTKELTYLLKNATPLKKEQTDAMEKLSAEFPYFQSVRSVVLKGLKDQESFRYNQELKKTAAYTTDRSVLFDFITSPFFSENAIQEKPIFKEEIEIPSIISMDDAIAMRIEEAEDVLNPELFSARKENNLHEQITPEDLLTQKSENTEQKEKENLDKSPEEELQINAPLNFNKKEAHSFTEWLKLTSLKPIDSIENQNTIVSDGTEKEKTIVQKEKFDLIDEFIANTPKIKPVNKNSPPARNLAKEYQVPSDELMTETLARVYLAQKNYKKAIQAYRILILKNPEKSGFFADQIRAVQKLQENK